MALVTAPLMSLDASGSVAKTVTFSKWKGRNYVRQTVIPHNPKSAAQTGMRSAVRFLSQIWASIKVAVAADYLALADAQKISPFNAFIQVNLNRWRNGDGFTQAYPAAETVTPGTITLGTPEGGQRNVVLTVTPSTATGLQGIAIFRDDEEITTINWNNCIHIIETDAINAVVWTDAPLNAGTYHYRAAFLSNDGLIGEGCADQTGTAT